MKHVLVAVLLAACSKSSGSTDCEALKDKYLAFTEQKMKDALGGVEAGANKDAMIAQGHKELDMARDRFVGVCKELGDKLDGSCFEQSALKDRERKKHCREIEKELDLDHRLYAP